MVSHEWSKASDRFQTKSTNNSILPLAKSTKSEWTPHSHFESKNGWLLAGNGEKYSDCGSALLFGCDNVDGHNVKGLLKDYRGKVYVEIRRRTCLRGECPVCYEKWAGKEASKIEYRLGHYHTKHGRVIHVVLSPRSHQNIRELRKEAYRLAQKAGILGGVLIVHPWRRVCIFCGTHPSHGYRTCSACGGSSFRWAWSPHFHVLGYGWIRNTPQIYKETGWVIKNLGVRKTIGGTAHNQLSHAGIKKGTHTITWFGQLAYNKLKIPKMPKQEKPKCPMCGNELHRILAICGSYDESKESFWIPEEQVIWKQQWKGYG